MVSRNILFILGLSVLLQHYHLITRRTLLRQIRKATSSTHSLIRLHCLTNYLFGECLLLGKDDTDEDVIVIDIFTRMQVRIIC